MLRFILSDELSLSVTLTVTGAPFTVTLPCAGMAEYPSAVTVKGYIPLGAEKLMYCAVEEAVMPLNVTLHEFPALSPVL